MVARLLHFGAAGRFRGDDSKSDPLARTLPSHRSTREISMATAMMANSAPTHISDFLTDVIRASHVIDSRLRRSLTPEQYVLVQDLVLATRISTIAQDALEDCVEPTVAA
jgi:hypothetical protein